MRAMIDRKNIQPDLISDLIETDRPIESLISALLLNSSSKLLLGPDHAEDPYRSVAMLIDGGEVKDGSVFDLADLKKKYKKIDCYFEPVKIADTGEIRLPYDEVEEHRAANGVKWNSEANCFVVNPSFVGNLCMSYLIDNRGIITVSRKLMEDEKNRVRHYFVIEIVHTSESAGREEYAVLQEKLDRYVSS